MSGAEDADADDDTATFSIAVDSRDSALYGAASVFVDATVEDNDGPSTKVTLSVTPDAVEESPEVTPVTVTVTGRLDGAPLGADTEVTVSVSAGTGTGTAGTGDFVAVPDFTLTITAGSQSGTADFPFTPVDDDVDEDEDNETVAVTGMVSGLDVVPTVLAIVDDDTKGIALSPMAVTVTEGATTVNEDPATDGAAIYTAVLTSEPTGTVTVYADAPAGSDGRVASSGAAALTASLTFTTGSWDEPQSFTVTAVEDADSTPDTVVISHRVAGADYEGLTVDDSVTVTVTDNDQPGIHVDPAMAEVTEGRTAQSRRQAQRPAHGQCHGDADRALGGLGERYHAHLHHGQLVDGADGDGDGARRRRRVASSDGHDRLHDRLCRHRRRLRRGDGELRAEGVGG